MSTSFEILAQILLQTWQLSIRSAGIRLDKSRRNQWTTPEYQIWKWISIKLQYTLIIDNYSSNFWLHRCIMRYLLSKSVIIFSFFLTDTRHHPAAKAQSWGLWGHGQKRIKKDTRISSHEQSRTREAGQCFPNYDLPHRERPALPTGDQTKNTVGVGPEGIWQKQTI